MRKTTALLVEKVVRIARDAVPAKQGFKPNLTGSYIPRFKIGLHAQRSHNAPIVQRAVKEGVQGRVARQAAVKGWDGLQVVTAERATG